MDRTEARNLLFDLTLGDSLRRHARTVELVMEAYAKKLNENEEEWAVTGMLHDADYEAFPEKHPHSIVTTLKICGEYKIAHAISAHHTKWNVSYDTLLDKALVACDEITGFVVACCKVRPDGIGSLEASFVLQKLKQKNFAAKVEREEIIKGAEIFQVDLENHITFIINVLKEHRRELKI